MLKPIRVLQVSKSTGGVGRYVRSLAYGLRKDRFDVLVVCLSEGADDLAVELSQIHGVRAFSMPMDRYSINPMTDMMVWWKLTKLIHRENIDLIHAHASKPGFLARVAAAGTGIPVLYCPAGFSFHDGVSKWKAYMYAIVERFAASMLTEKIITVCHAERELARRYHVGRDLQFVNVYNGVEPNDFTATSHRDVVRASLNVPNEAFLIGTVARLSQQKAPLDLVKVASLIYRVYPNVRFVWIGDGELEFQIQELINSEGLMEIFHLLGSRDDVPDLLSAMDCFVLSSRWEGFSISVLEAMASGLPVVMTQVSGADEAVVDGRTGFLVPIGDIDALVERLGRLISDPAMSRKFGQAGRRRLEENFTEIRMVKEIERLYEGIILKKSR